MSIREKLMLTGNSIMDTVKEAVTVNAAHHMEPAVRYRKRIGPSGIRRSVRNTVSVSRGPLI